MRVALYVRVSTEEQKRHGLSVDAQITALTQYCQDNNLEIYKIYNDAGISAHISYKRRPALLQMIRDCQAGLIDKILFTKVDRWFRSVRDYHLCMEQLNGVPWKAIWQPFESDSVEGSLQFNVYLAVMEDEAVRVSDRIKSTFEYKKARGDFVGKAAAGYMIENGRLIKDPAKAPMIELMFETYLRTWTVHSTSMALSAAGYKADDTTIRLRLKNPAYAGRASGTECEPYISWDDHLRIMDHMATYIRPSQKHTYIFSSILFCKHCGKRLSAHPGKRIPGKTMGEHVVSYYYYCMNQACITQHVSVHVTETRLEKHLLQVIKPMMDQYRITNVTARKKDMDPNAIPRLREKLKRVGVRYEEGDLTTEEYKAKRLEINRELENLERIQRAVTPIELPSHWEFAYRRLNPVNKRAFWLNCVDKIYISKENKYDLAPEDVVFR